jgi:putative flippase GtrA
MMVLTNQKERARFLRFAFVGAIGAVIDFGVFNLLVHFTTISPVVASVCSFITAVCSNFVWNRYWTYPDSRSKHVAHQLLQLVVISLIGLLIRTPLFAFLEKTLIKFFTSNNMSIPLTPTFLGHNISLAIAIIVVMFWNFFANRLWTYADID